MQASICLNMIVTEADSFYLPRVLGAIRPFIQRWVIANKGCSEETLDTIEKLLSGIEGEIVDIEQTLDADVFNGLVEFSSTSSDYLLILRPWQLIDTEHSFFDLSDAKDGYYLNCVDVSESAELALLSTKHKWHFYGLANETVLSNSASDFGRIQDLRLKTVALGSHISIMREQEAERLEAQLESQADDSHSLFQLARIRLHQGQHKKALSLFDRYLAGEQHWDAEWRWYASYYRAKLIEKLDSEHEAIVQAYLLAYSIRPKRLESLVDLARYYRLKGDATMAHLYSKQAFENEKPENETLDLSVKTYQWQIPTEYAMNAQRIGDHRSTIKAANRALLNARVPYNLRDSLIHSRQKSVDALQEAKRKESSLRGNRIRLVIPFKNAGDYLKDCVRTLKTQTYTNFVATFVDDCSTDDSISYIPRNDPRFELIRNTEWQGALVNRMKVILDSSPNDIMVWLDGDDQLAHDLVLEKINEIYESNDCWLSYGQYISQRGNLGHGVPYVSQQHLIEELESGEMRFPSHPITHRAGLFQRVQEFDPNYSCFKDNQGNWLDYASDAVLARPLFYLAGYERIYYCNEALYLYTEAHENSEFLANQKEQLETCRLITQRLRCPTVSSFSP